ncbi:hypothetical protein BA950_11465 [Erythrobacter sp. SAORIC-644]|nr:hypothetical protein BA950_11465 [Erythrobacter sp. SAORIC-644]
MSARASLKTGPLLLRFLDYRTVSSQALCEWPRRSALKWKEDVHGSTIAFTKGLLRSVYLASMQSDRVRVLNHLIRVGFSDGFAAPVIILLLFALLIARGIWLLPEGYNGEDGLNATFSVLLVVWCMGMVSRCVQPTSRLAACVVTICLFAALSLSSSLAAAASAIDGGDYIDPWLFAIDKFLFPFYDWVAVALAIPNYDALYWLLNHNYNALNWQPFVFIGLTLLWGRIEDLGTFVTAWGLGLLGCILPFHWLPALSPFRYHGIEQDDLPGNMVALPWEFIPVMEGMRDGTIRSMGLESITGMVTVPSFHACAATILSWAFWRYRWVRWPFVLVNVGMALAAVPIGSHYLIDILAGVAVGSLAVVGATALNRPPSKLRTVVSKPRLSLQPV